MNELIPLQHDESRLAAGKLRRQRRRHAPAWFYVETGSGRPLVLLHGIGMSHTAWSATIPYVRERRRVIAFDIAGSGSSPPLSSGIQPTIPNLVDALEQSLHEIDVELPVDIAGNSLGGCMALEAASRGFARTVVAISPACLWRDRPPLHVQHVFRALRFAATNFGGVVKAALRLPLLRELALAVPLSVGSRRMSASDARQTIEDLATSTRFEDTFESTRAPFCGRDIAVPVTVAFGDRDWILPKATRRRDALPAHASWVEKHGWGHVPMWADPAGVSRLILEGTGIEPDTQSDAISPAVETGA